jgi:hypothetical protein
MRQYWVNDSNFLWLLWLSFEVAELIPKVLALRFAPHMLCWLSTCFVLIHGLPVVDVHSIGAFVRSITLLWTGKSMGILVENPWEIMADESILAYSGILYGRMCVCVGVEFPMWKMNWKKTREKETVSI